MGIEKIFGALVDISDKFTHILSHKLDASYLLFDANSIVYVNLFKILSELNFVLYSIIVGRQSTNKVTDILNKYTIQMNNDPKKFSEQFTQDKLEGIIINIVEQYIIHALTNYIKPDMLKLLYMAFDGVPSKSKMVEQRKRRYNRVVDTLLKHKIFEKYEDDLKKNDNNRYLYETYKIKWATHNITPGTQFMEKLNDRISSSDFIKTVKSVCKNLETYIYSGTDEPGEAENKIVNYLRMIENPPKANYVIYSPDSDVILLCLLLNCKLSPTDDRRITKLTMLRHNNQENRYNVIDIDKFGDTVFQYVLKHVAITDRDAIINDIVFLFTVFGDDFVPKLESIDVKLHIGKILDIYIDVLKNNNNKFIVSYNNNTRIINQDVLVDIFYRLKKIEGSNLKNIYMSNNYKNYRSLKRLLKANDENFIEVVNNFLFKLRKFNNKIRNVVDNSLDDFIKTWTSGDNMDFTKILKKFARLGVDTRRMTEDDFVRSYVDYYDHNNKLPYVSISFIRYSRSLKDPHHKTKLEKKLDNIDPKLRITPYDEEIYKLDNMLDEYTIKFNAAKLNIGYISINTKSYTFKSEKIIKGVEKYYEDFFNIEDINGDKMDELVQHYIDGLIWIFEYYFNNYNSEYHRKHADVWFYPYTHAPLSTQIFKYLKKKTSNPHYIENVSKKLLDCKVNRNIFFNCLEQLMYVSPAPYVLDIIPKEYHKFAKTSPYYYDLEHVANEILNNNTNDVIDCRGQMFNSKCHITAIEHVQNFNEDQKFIKELRSIKLSKASETRNCIYNPDKNNIMLHNYKSLARASQIDYNKLYGYYKKKYKDWGHLAYKSMYKYIKHELI